MGAFKMAGMTIASIFKKPETFQYPFQEKAAIPGAKGHIVNDASKCILCAKCQKTCPCHCIQVSKDPRSWTIEPFMCVLCGSCVRVCPTKCLSMDGDPTEINTEKTVIELAVPEKEKKAK